MSAQKIKPVCPGEILQEEFLGPLTLSQYRLSKDIKVPARRINEIIHGVRAISIDTALRLGRYFGNSPEFWMQLQMRHDLTMGKQTEGKKLEREVSPYQFHARQFA